MKYLLIALFGLLSTTANAQDITAYKVDDLMQRIQNSDTLYVVNFWATWCGPCVKELPEFDKMQQQFAGRPVKILLVSTDFKEDYPQKIAKFVKKKKLQQEVIWLNETNANEFIPKIESTWGGSIPATLIMYNKNQYRNFFEGAITARQIGLLIDKQLAY